MKSRDLEIICDPSYLFYSWQSSGQGFFPVLHTDTVPGNLSQKSLIEKK